MINEPVTIPVALALVGLTGMQRADGEIKVAKRPKNLVPTLSTNNCSIEDVARNTGKPFWFQLCTMKDTGFVNSLIDEQKLLNAQHL